MTNAKETIKKLKEMRNFLTECGIYTDEIDKENDNRYWFFGNGFLISYNEEGSSELVLSGKIWDIMGAEYGSEYFEYGLLPIHKALPLITDYYDTYIF